MHRIGIGGAGGVAFALASRHRRKPTHLSLDKGNGNL
jgi:hypothetical protein